MSQIATSRRAFLGASAVAALGLTLLSSQKITASVLQPEVPFQGYNPFAEQKTDLRNPLSLTKPIAVKGTLFNENGRNVVSNAKIEVWHLSPGSQKYRHRGYFYTDVNGNYSFITDFPNRVEGQKARIYFKISDANKSEFTELLIDSNAAYITDKHWVKNKQLERNLFPQYKQGSTTNDITFNFTI